MNMIMPVPPGLLREGGRGTGRGDFWRILARESEGAKAGLGDVEGM